MAEHKNVSRRSFLLAAGSSVAGLALTACGQPQPAAAPTAVNVPEPTIAPEPPITDPDAALQRLLEGNQRFVASQSLPLNESAARRAEVVAGQQPFAQIFSCVDSRVPPELIFDRGIGDLFVIRTAGHALDRASLGSLEFGVDELKIPLILVMGHEACGAVNATIEAIDAGHTPEADVAYLVEAIAPAYAQAKIRGGEPLATTIVVNTEQVVQRLRAAPILAEAIAAGKLKVVGARYALDTGAVEVLEV